MYRIRNWSRWQTYRKDRGDPPWVKVYRRLMQDPNWIQLSDSERGQLVAMWMLAGGHGGNLPTPDGCQDDNQMATWLQRACFMTDPPDLQLFVRLRFIEMTTKWLPDGCHDDNQTVAKVTPQSRGEERRVEERRSALDARAREGGTEGQISDNIMSLPEVEHVLATDDQISHLQALALAVGTTPEDALREHGLNWIPPRPSKVAASFVIDKLRQQRDNGRRPKTFLEQRMANNAESTKELLLELEARDGQQ